MPFSVWRRLHRPGRIYVLTGLASPSEDVSKFRVAAALSGSRPTRRTIIAFVDRGSVSPEQVIQPEVAWTLGQASYAAPIAEKSFPHTVRGFGPLLYKTGDVIERFFKKIEAVRLLSVRLRLRIALR